MKKGYQNPFINNSVVLDF